MGKYLKYAVGEILLVMIGILLALQVNNWNENRKDRIKEQVILNEVHQEFSSNLETFYPHKRNQQGAYNRGEIVFRNIYNLQNPASRDSVYRNAMGMFGGYPFHPSTGVVESLISSGDFKLIRNDTLRQYLVSWKDVLKEYTDDVAIDLNFWSLTVEPYIIQHGSFTNMGSDANKALLTDPVFLNIIVRKQFYQRNIMTSIEGPNGLQHYLEEIVRLSASR